MSSANAKRQWVYRPTDAEHEKLLAAMADHPEFTSVAQVVREAVMRWVHEDDRRKLFTQIDEMIEDLKGTKDKFLRLVLDQERE